MGLGVAGCKQRARFVAVACDAGGQVVKALVGELVVQFVQKFHTNDFTVAPVGAE